MKIDSNSWHCRVYLWWYKNKYHYPNEKKFSNLCPYMRAVMFWAPLRAVFGTWIKLWPKVPVNLITIPLTIYAIPAMLGYVSYDAKLGLWRAYGIIACITALGCLLVGISWAFAPDGADVTKPIRKAYFTSLLREYLRSAHDRICPEVDWK